MLGKNSYLPKIHPSPESSARSRTPADIATAAEVQNDGEEEDCKIFVCSLFFIDTRRGPDLGQALNSKK